MAWHGMAWHGMAWLKSWQQDSMCNKEEQQAELSGIPSGLSSLPKFQDLCINVPLVPVNRDLIYSKHNACLV